MFSWYKSVSSGLVAGYMRPILREVASRRPVVGHVPVEGQWTVLLHHQSIHYRITKFLIT